MTSSAVGERRHPFCLAAITFRRLSEKDIVLASNRYCVDYDIYQRKRGKDVWKSAWPRKKDRDTRSSGEDSKAREDEKLSPWATAESANAAFNDEFVIAKSFCYINSTGETGRSGHHRGKCQSKSLGEPNPQSGVCPDWGWWRIQLEMETGE